MVTRHWSAKLAFGLGVAAALTLGAPPTPAQEAAPSGSVGAPGGPAPAPSADPNRRVPAFFGQVGLTPEQREEIYKVRARHRARIDDLQKQLSRAQAEMVAECEAVLNAQQKQLLAVRREASARAKAARAAARVSEKPAEKPSEKPAVKPAP